VPSRSKNTLNDSSVELNPNNVKQTLNDRLAAKVIDWALKNRVDQGNVAEFRWNLEDKALLQQIFADPKAVGLDLPMRDSKFRRFVQSIIQNGLNSTDVELFQRFKHRLPLRSLGLAHDLTDFSFIKEAGEARLQSKNKLQHGFYMLEISVEPRQFSARIQLEVKATYVKRGGVDQYPLRVKSATVAKRLVWLKRDADFEITIGMPDGTTINKADITQFRLARLTRNFFLSRLYKKLGKSFDMKQADRITDDVLASQWQHYERLFSQSYMQSLSRGSHGLSRSPTKTPSPNEQLQEILRLLAAKR
jgi:hypothetical protein